MSLPQPNQELYKKLFHELENESTYDQATRAGHQYVLDLKASRTYPSDESISELASFDEELPENSIDSHRVINQLATDGTPGTVGCSGGRYFGFVTGGYIPAGMAAKILSSFWDQNTASYVCSPITSVLETVVQKWIVKLLNLEPQTVVGFVSGSSVANMIALVAARFHILEKKGWDLNKRGIHGSPAIRIVAGQEVHSSVIKGIAVMGFGTDNIEYVDVDDQGRMIPDRLPRLDDQTIVILQAGNIHSGAVDDINTIASIAKKAGAWVHVDGAFGLWVRSCERLKDQINGLELVDSCAVDGHKTLNTPYDSGIVICKHPQALPKALNIQGNYFMDTQHRENKFYTLELSRRMRVAEFWATLKSLGTSGVDDLVYRLHYHAKLFEDKLSRIDGFEILNEIWFNQLSIACASDELTDEVVDLIQKDGVCWVGGSYWRGRRVIRISVSSWQTNEEDVDATVSSFKRALHKASEMIKV